LSYGNFTHGGGIVGGDVLQQKIHLQAATNALITTASAGKVYQSNGQMAQQLIEIKIDDNAGLEWLPQETIIFNGAVFRQHLRVDLGENSSWLGWEITRFGRSARGEKFLAGEWHSNWEIWRSGQPLWLDRSFLLGGKMIEGFSGLNDSALIRYFSLYRSTGGKRFNRESERFFPRRRDGSY
jgi:urease accessory protein